MGRRPDRDAPLSRIASDAFVKPRNNIACDGNNAHLTLAGYIAGIGDQTMRMFETVTSTMLAIAAQALVVGVVISTF